MLLPTTLAQFIFIFLVTIFSHHLTIIFKIQALICPSQYSASLIQDLAFFFTQLNVLGFIAEALTALYFPPLVFISSFV